MKDTPSFVRVTLIWGWLMRNIQLHFSYSMHDCMAMFQLLRWIEQNQIYDIIQYIHSNIFIEWVKFAPVHQDCLLCLRVLYVLWGGSVLFRVLFRQWQTDWSFFCFVLFFFNPEFLWYIFFKLLLNLCQGIIRAKSLIVCFSLREWLKFL